MTGKELLKLASKNNKSLKNIKYYEFQFGSDADGLLSLVILGYKTKTSSLYELYKLDNSELPKENDYSIILDSKNNAICLIRNTKVEIKKYKDVNEDDAYHEGEDDRTLSSYRIAHNEFFECEAKEYNITFNDESLIVIKTFEVVYSLYTLSKLTDDEVEDIFNWRYKNEYEVYNMPPKEYCIKEGYTILNKDERNDGYYSFHIDDKFAGFFHIMNNEKYFLLGIGIRPELCGKNYGRMLVNMAVKEMIIKDYNKPILLTVRTFNIRAMKCYKNAGFDFIKKYYESNMYTPGEMYIMRYFK